MLDGSVEGCVGRDVRGRDAGKKRSVKGKSGTHASLTYVNEPSCGMVRSKNAWGRVSGGMIPGDLRVGFGRWLGLADMSGSFGDLGSRIAANLLATTPIPPCNKPSCWTVRSKEVWGGMSGVEKRSVKAAPMQALCRLYARERAELLDGSVMGRDIRGHDAGKSTNWNPRTSWVERVEWGSSQ